MFVESVDSTCSQIINLNTGTGLRLIRSSYTDSHGYYIWRVEVISGGGTVLLKDADKDTAEKLYNRLKNEWVGNDTTTVV